MVLNKKPKVDKRKPKVEKISSVRSARLVLAAYLLVILLSQLFSFEDFPGLIPVFGDNIAAKNAIAILLVVAELLSLVFLVGINVAKIISKISFISVFGAMVLLSVLEMVAFSSGQTMFFGATFDLPSGTWSLFFLAAMWILVIWSVLADTSVKRRKR